MHLNRITQLRHLKLLLLLPLARLFLLLVSPPLQLALLLLLPLLLLPIETPNRVNIARTGLHGKGQRGRKPAAPSAAGTADELAASQPAIPVCAAPAQTEGLMIRTLVCTAKIAIASLGKLQLRSQSKVKRIFHRLFSRPLTSRIFSCSCCCEAICCCISLRVVSSHLRTSSIFFSSAAAISCSTSARQPH